MAVDAPTAAPLHARLRQAIHEQIIDETLQPGEGLPSERVIQEHLGVSRSTVRHAFSALIQAGLLQSVPGTSTFVRQRVEPVSQRGLVGMIVSSSNFHFFYPQLAHAFNERLRRAGYSMVMALHNDRADTLVKIVEELLGQGVVGLAITPPRTGSADALVTSLYQRGIPTIYIGRRGGNSPVDCVATDNEHIGYQATRQLIDLGHRAIVHLGFLDYSTGGDRAAGYERAMREAGLEPHIVEMPQQPEPTHPESVLAEHLAEPAGDMARMIWSASNRHQPTAMFCFNDVIAMGVYKALRDLGLRIPHDVALVSVDNLPTISHFEVPLTTFALPGEEIGRQGADLLVHRLAGDSTPHRTHLLPALPILRQSTAAPGRQP